jgi:hypothetical protein
LISFFNSKSSVTALNMALQDGLGDYKYVRSRVKWLTLLFDQL